MNQAKPSMGKKWLIFNQNNMVAQENHMKLWNSPERCSYVSGTFLESFIALSDFIESPYSFGRYTQFLDFAEIWPPPRFSQSPKTGCIGQINIVDQ